jgi:hypothetical protein
MSTGAAPIETLTIHLTADAARRLRRVAEISRRPLDEIIADTLQGSLPPLLEDVPAPFRAELAGLESLSTAVLWQQFRARMPAPQLTRYDQLLAENSAGTLTDAGRDELAQLRQAADQLMYRKAYAALLLRWRGERFPSRTELEAESA